MNSIDLPTLTIALRKANIQKSTSNMSSRVSGWCNSWQEGYEISRMLNWTSYFVRNGYRKRFQNDYQEVSISYCLASNNHRYEGKDTNKIVEEGIKRIETVLNELGLRYKKDEDFETGFEIILKRNSSLPDCN